jgi:hypothetical protein
MQKALDASSEINRSETATGQAVRESAKMDVDTYGLQKVC